MIKGDKENALESKKGQTAVQKMSKKQLLKTTSRSRLAKVNGKVSTESQALIYPS